MAVDPRPQTEKAAQPVWPPTLSIHLRFRPSVAFLGILAEMNAQFSDWTDGSYDWADQTVDFLHSKKPLPDFGEAFLRTPLSQRALRDLLQLAIALLSGEYLAVRNYLQHSHFVLVIGYPRSGGSYLTKELLRTIGLDHTRVSEALAHDGFPQMRDHWYIPNGPQPYFHLQDAVFQVAEFLVIAHLYYRHKSVCQPNGTWLIPKKMHKLVYWAGSFKMLLGKGAADYLVTVRHPVPTAVSIYEKSGGLPSDGLFPAAKPRSAIELWVRDDLVWIGYSLDEIARMKYFRAVEISWTAFYTRMASSGLFLGDRDEIRFIPYGREALEGVVNQYRTHYGSQRPAESFFIHDKSGTVPPECLIEGDAAVASVRALWRSLGLVFPSLSWS